MANITVSDSTQAFENLQFTQYDAHYNFAYSTIATAPSPASSGTQLTVASGDGANFPPGPFNATVWPAGGRPTAATAEIVRVTGKSGDILQIVRTQENSSARSIGVGDQIAATVTAKTIKDPEGLLYNPYKFYVYRNGAWTAGNTVFAKIAFDTKVYDTSGNFDVTTNNRFTAPVAGFYHFSARAASSNGTTLTIISLYKNGSEILRGPNIGWASSVQVIGSTVNGDLQLAAGDYVEVFFDAAGGAGDTGAPYTYFQGYLVSQL